jgi:hypothetical protein
METKTKSLVVTGSLTIYGAKNVFSQIDLEFKGLKINSRVNQPETINSYDLNGGGGTFLTIFSKINKDLSLLALSEDTVVRYCHNHRDILELEGQKAFFYLGDNVVAKVTYYLDGLHINKYELDSKIIWMAEGKRPRLFVVPAE